MERKTQKFKDEAKERLQNALFDKRRGKDEYGFRTFKPSIYKKQLKAKREWVVKQQEKKALIEKELNDILINLKEKYNFKGKHRAFILNKRG